MESTQAQPQTTAVGSETKPLEQAAANVAGVKPETPAPYTPNYKFKVIDKEHEFDQFLHGAIKDVETEKKVRELYEKAYGLDIVKPKFQETREKLKGISSELQEYQTAVQNLREHYTRGDLDSFFAQMNIPQEKILQWVLDKAQYSELPPEQKRILDEKKNAEQRAYSLEKEKGQYEQQMMQQAVEAKSYQLQVELERPDIASFAATFEAKVGKPGAFREEVIKWGEAAWNASQGKVNLTPGQAVQEVLAHYKHFLQTAPEQPAPVVQPQAVPTPTVEPKPKTLPNVNGRATSPMKSKPKSLDELRQKYKEMSGQV